MAQLNAPNPATQTGAPPGTQIVPSPINAGQLLASIAPLRNPAATNQQSRPYNQRLQLVSASQGDQGIPIELKRQGLATGLQLYITGSIVVNLPAEVSAGNASGFQVSQNFPFDVISNVSFNPSGARSRVNASGVQLREEGFRLFGLKDPNLVSFASGVGGLPNQYAFDISGSKSVGFYSTYTIAGTTTTLTPLSGPIYNATAGAVVATINYGFFLEVPWVDNFVDFNGLIDVQQPGTTFQVVLNTAQNGQLPTGTTTGQNTPVALITEGTGVMGTYGTTSISFDPLQQGISMPPSTSLYLGLAQVQVMRQTQRTTSLSVGDQGIEIPLKNGFFYLAAINDIRLNYTPSTQYVTDWSLNLAPGNSVLTYTLEQYLAEYAKQHYLSPSLGIVCWDGANSEFINGQGDSFGWVNATAQGGLADPHIRIGLASNTVFGPENSNYVDTLTVSQIVI